MMTTRQRAQEAPTPDAPEPTAPAVRRQPLRLLPLLLVVLALLIVLGGARLWRSPAMRERRLSRMSAAELQQWTARNPKDALAFLHLGLAWQRGGEIQKAAAEYVKALNLDPTLSRARSRLAGTLVMSGQNRAAETLLLQGIQADPSFAELHRGLGQIYEAQQDFRRAAASWEKATLLAPEDAVSWFHLGNCWIGLNDEARAMQAFERAAALEPLSGDYRKSYASTLRLRGRYPEAEKNLRSALFLRPDDAQAHFELMKTLRDRDGATEQVEAAMQRAAALQPENPQFRYYLATVAQERGKLQQAVDEYGIALQLYARNQPRGLASRWTEWGLWLSYQEGIHFNRARLLKRLGRAQEAERELARFRRLSAYHVRANQLIGQAANRPRDAALRFQLARAHADAGFAELAAEQEQEGRRLQRGQ